MALIKTKIGLLVEPYKERCNIPNLTEEQVSGINKDKEFFEPSKQVGGDTSKYLNVPPRYFACNLMHVGRDCVLPVAYNHSNCVKRVSPAYSVFKLKHNCGVLEVFFFMFLNSPEKDRFFWFNCDSSIRDGMTWEDFCELEIELPDLPTQQKYVDIYNGMIANQKSYESGLEDLKLVCDGYIENLKKTTTSEEIGKYLVLKREKNSVDQIKEVFGVSNSLKFIEASSSVDKGNLSSYKIVNFQDIAYVPTTHMKIWAVAISNKAEPFVVSPIYEVFSIKDKNELCPEYLFSWLCRKETIRYAFYNSWGSARENFVFDDLCTIKMPIPKIEMQRSIAKILVVYETRKRINEILKNQIKNICPILIKGSIEEAKRSN